MKQLLPFVTLFLLVCNACKNTPTTDEAPAFAITKKPFGKVDNADITLYKLAHANGFSVEIMNYGAAIVSIITPDKNGQPGDVVLGFDNLDDYVKPGNPYIGGIVGRYANRIAQAQFSLEGQTYQLAANDNGHSLHGGLRGFDKVVWSATEQRTDTSAMLTLRYTSPDGEEGYPGNLQVTVTYIVTNDYALRIDYQAIVDKATPVNLTNHAYFNLAAGQALDILGHELHLNAYQYTPVDATLIPTGELRPVTGGPMDFTTAKPIGKEIAMTAGGYDHNFVLNKQPEQELSLAATLYEPGSGRFMEMYTTEPAVQFYSGNFLNGMLRGKNDEVYTLNYGLCLEAQHYPDSPNQPNFPNTILRPGETYRQTTVYRFAVRPE
ncbi:MAG TPA: aldose epimerase family protein [Saprospiraceae bacterium]|nr:aldose epimerase family protein [Saprospiraceae bacterium]HMP22968.1 aldose epimerase family protein [Saprospiraceae bacterium]